MMDILLPAGVALVAVGLVFGFQWIWKQMREDNKGKSGRGRSSETRKRKN